MKDLFKVVEIELNHSCNLACSYCPNKYFERIEKGIMDMQLYEKIIRQLEEMSFNGKISYSFYSEPTLIENLEIYVKKAKIKLPDVQIEIYSNGFFLTIERLRSLLESGVDSFIVTRHESVQGNFHFEKVLQDLQSDEKGKVKYRNFDEIKMTNRGGLLGHMKNGFDQKFMPCLIPTNMISITVKGSVLPCFEDFFQKNQMGNINTEHIAEIWKKVEYVKFRKNLKDGLRHLNSVCVNCNRFEVL